MKQLVELGENKDKFAEHNTEVIAVFREEKKGEDGLKAIKEKTNTSFTLALDNGKEQTSRYSAARGEFTGYVMSPKGEITKIIKGNLRDRAKSNELLEAVKASAGGSASKAGSGAKKGSGAKAGSGSKAGSAKKAG